MSLNLQGDRVVDAPRLGEVLGRGHYALRGPVAGYTRVRRHRADEGLLLQLYAQPGEAARKQVGRHKNALWCPVGALADHVVCLVDGLVRHRSLLDLGLPYIMRDQGCSSQPNFYPSPLQTKKGSGLPNFLARSSTGRRLWCAIGPALRLICVACVAVIVCCRIFV